MERELTPTSCPCESGELKTAIPGYRRSSEVEFCVKDMDLGLVPES